MDLANNLINYLNNAQKLEKEKENEKNNNLKKECLDLLINLLFSNKKLLGEYTSKDETNKQIILNLFKKYFSDNGAINKNYFIQNINQSINKAKTTQNNEYIQFLFELVNTILDNLINSQIKTEENTPDDSNVFTPDNAFFDLYNNLYKTKCENKDKDKESSSDNSHLLKIYELIMKNIKNIKEDKKVDMKIFISLLQLLKTQIKENDQLKNELLFKETEGNTLFNFLLEKFTSKLNTKKKEEEEESLIDNDNNEADKEEEKKKNNNKFICLENMKEEKKDDTSDEELTEISNEFIYDCLSQTKDPKLISELIKILKILKNSRKKNGNESDSDEDDDKNDEAPTSSSNYTTKSCGHVGLKNLGCICYMNSIMQQMYMVPTFRYAIMSADDGETPKPNSRYQYTIDDDNLLHQLQNMYTYLTFSDKMDYNPREFCFSYKDFDGNPINVRAQQDSQEFYNNFCDKIENSLKKTKFKYIVSDVFS